MRKILAALFKTGLASIITIIFGVISTKIIAVVLGPTGVGLFSLIRQTILTAATIGSMGGQTVITQGIATREKDDRLKYLQTVLWLFIPSSLSIIAIIIIFAPAIAQLIFSSQDAHMIALVRYLSIPIVLLIIFTYLISIINGYKFIGMLAIGQIIVAFTIFAISYPMASIAKAGYTTALVYLFIFSNLAGIIFFSIALIKLNVLQPIFSNIKFFIDTNISKSFYKMASITLITGIIATGTLLTLRGMIANHSGLATAGIFDVAWTLSMTYVMLLAGAFGTYYLPTLSSTKDIDIKNKLIGDVLKLFIILSVPLITMIIVLKPLLISILYTHEFMPALTIMNWMLIGDYFKIVTWIIAMPAFAYADMKTYFSTEVVFNIGFLVLSYIALFYFHSIEGIGFSFLFMYIINFLFYLYYITKIHKFQISKNLIYIWVLGLILVIMASFFSWYNEQVNLTISVIFISIAIMYSWLILTKNERQQIINKILK